MVWHEVATGFALAMTFVGKISNCAVLRWKNGKEDKILLLSDTDFATGKGG
jgi:hypothetical protein